MNYPIYFMVMACELFIFGMLRLFTDTHVDIIRSYCTASFILTTMILMLCDIAKIGYKKYLNIKRSK